MANLPSPLAGGFESEDWSSQTTVKERIDKRTACPPQTVEETGWY
ncbi:hypothetical protein CPTD_00037 [Corynebacterium pseudotuberculosis]|nr:Hypothetical protein BFF96_0995 [Corynebacterium pseudotuberculosis]AUY60378.1 Hypothetical protein BFG00_0991 [Corynebacterium pseudotuberculosis]KEX88299.1 hypothetical protein CPTD_00037 [Corynebacterium pseudotuberculosis]